MNQQGTTMTMNFEPAGGVLASLDLLKIEIAGKVGHVRLNRPVKRNAINDTMILQLQTCFQNWPSSVQAVVMSGEGDHFCAGLDLSELSERSVADAVLHSRMWHAAIDTIALGRVPVIAVLHGAVVGGGLEIASAAHVRVAERSAYYGLPEGQRGIFVGGGGSVRVPRLVGVSCMTDMMLTGARDRCRRGPPHRLVALPGRRRQGFAKACELANKVASNAPLSNFAVIQALPRIADLSPSDGLFVESLMAAIAQGDEAAKQRIRDFLEKRAGKVERQ